MDTNIRNHNRSVFDYELCARELWDFHLHLRSSGGHYEGLQKGCLSAFIDTTDDSCIADRSLVSKKEFVYAEGKSKGITLENIGFTSIDNGIFTYDKTEISNKEFWEIFTKSKIEIPEGDTRLTVRPVNGNNGIYRYDSELVSIGGQRVAKLDGGFYQGFFRVGDGCEYSVLPHKVGDGWSMEFVICPHDFGKSDEGRATLNDTYPENKGTFFYLGTRAENKWIQYYESECDLEYSCWRYSNSDYFNDNYLRIGVHPNDYFQNDGYLSDPSYHEKDMEITPDGETETTDEDRLNQANVRNIETDNKFIFFDRSKDGFTTKTWEEGTKVILKDVRIPKTENLYLLANRSKDGMTVKELEEYKDAQSRLYDIYTDIHNNAFSLFVDSDGAVGYKYLTCGDEDCGYKIDTERSNKGIIRSDKWSVVHVQFSSNISEGSPSDKFSRASQKMKVRIYVDGKLRIQSKELPLIHLRELNETSDKQEGVPFNISLGGGTQGLCDVVYEDFLALPKYVFPLEKAFGGSFVGYFKSFKFYNCLKSFDAIRTNYEYEKEHFPQNIRNGSIY